MTHDEEIKILESVKNAYNSIAQEFSASRWRPWKELYAFQKYLKKNDSVLDLGCGNGRLTKMLQGVKYTGVDLSENLVKEAKKNFPQFQFKTGSALDIPFVDKKFDVVFMIAVLHEIPGSLRKKALLETKRVLKNNGLLLMTNWNLKEAKPYLYYMTKLKKLLKISNMDWGDIMVPWHNKAQRYYHAFTKKELSALAQEIDFKVLEQYNKNNNFISVWQKNE